MSGYVKNEHGNISISEEVISQFAGHAALDCAGIVGMATTGVKDGIVNLLKGDNITKGVNVLLESDGITINFHIIVSYGVNIKTVVNNLISSVKYQVEDYTDMTVKAINVYVEGVRVID